MMDTKQESYRGWSLLGKVDKYGEWCEKILDLQTDIERIYAYPISLRQVDNYLLSIMSLDGQGAGACQVFLVDGWLLRVKTNQERTLKIVYRIRPT
ncbi:hypothetical protein ACE0DR_16505 [Azotobacter sp. CWF10]